MTFLRLQMALNLFKLKSRLIENHEHKHQESKENLDRVECTHIYKKLAKGRMRSP